MAELGFSSDACWPETCVIPNGAALLGELPRIPLPVVVEMVEPVSRPEVPSSPKPPCGRKLLASLPYRARCCRANNSRRPSSLMVLGLIERSDLLDDISASTPATNQRQEATTISILTHSDCIAVPDDSFAARVHAAPPSYV